MDHRIVRLTGDRSPLAVDPAPAHQTAAAGAGQQVAVVELDQGVHRRVGETDRAPGAGRCAEPDAGILGGSCRAFHR